MKYAFIKENAKVFSVELMCAILAVSRSGYYSWLMRPISDRDISNKELDQKIAVLFKQHKSRYGALRITKALQADGEVCSKNRVAKRMRKMGLRAIAARQYKVTTDSRHNNHVFDNILDRDFTTTGINQKWVQDITYVRTKEGWMYLAVVIDLYSRAIVGWSMSNRLKKQLVCDALHMALSQRKYPKGVIVHSDRGSQYCSCRYRRLISRHQLVGSMSRKGNCLDNSVAESFFHTLKLELRREMVYATRDSARRSIFGYIEIYYNRQRMHSSIDYRVPIDVELRA